MTADSSPILPGRLGTPGMQLKDDPRADPRMIAVLEPIGLAGAGEPAPVDADSPLDDLLEFVATSEAGFEGLFGALAAGLPPVEHVTSSVEVIRGLDGNDITLFIHRPDGAQGPVPGVLHIHGGGWEAGGKGNVRPKPVERAAASANRGRRNWRRASRSCGRWLFAPCRRTLHAP